MGVSPSPDVVVLDPVDPKTASAPLSLQLDLTLAMGDAVKIDGYGMDGSLGGSLRVQQQPGRDMRATGTLEVDGRYRAYGQNLQITRGRLCGRTRRSAIRCSTCAPNARWARHCRHSRRRLASAPRATGLSEPAKERIRSAGLPHPRAARCQPDRRRSRQLGAAKSALNAGTGLLAAELGARIGLDDAGVTESRALGADVLTVGKYLSPKLYVGYGVSLLGTGQVLMLKYLLRKGFDIQIESSTVENRASVNWRKEK
jgi:translocation and assembly module TamB